MCASEAGEGGAVVYARASARRPPRNDSTGGDRAMPLLDSRRETTPSHARRVVGAPPLSCRAEVAVDPPCKTTAPTLVGH